MASRISRRDNAGSLKGKDGLAGRFGGNRLLEPFCRGKIDPDTQHFRETVPTATMSRSDRRRPGANSAMTSTSDTSRTAVPRA